MQTDYEKYFGKEDDPTIPGEVVTIMRKNDIPWLAAFRIYAAMTQEEVAKALNLSVPDYVSQEVSEEPQVELLSKVSKIVGAEPGALYDLYYGED